MFNINFPFLLQFRWFFKKYVLHLLAASKFVNGVSDESEATGVVVAHVFF